MNLCAERVAALNMYVNSGQTVVKRLIAFRDMPPGEKASGMPCGACREFFLQLSERNKDTEIMIDYEKRKTVTISELIPRLVGMGAIRPPVNRTQYKISYSKSTAGSNDLRYF